MYFVGDARNVLIMCKGYSFKDPFQLLGKLFNKLSNFEKKKKDEKKLKLNRKEYSPS